MALISFSSIIFAICMCSVDSARILAVFPTPSISHQVVFRPVTQELARRGHEVTVITTDPAFSKGKAPGNLTEVDLHDLSYKVWLDMFFDNPTVTKATAHATLKRAYEALMKIFEIQMKSDEVQEILNDRSKDFDLLIVEACVRPALVLSHKYKVPLIVFSSFGPFHGIIEAASGPFHPLLSPEQYQHRLHNLTIWEKMKAVWAHYKLQNILWDLEEPETKMGRRLFGPDVPSITELANNVDLLFLNVHAAWDNNRSVPPSVVYLGGLPQKVDKDLPKDLKSYLDSSKQGVIYVSFGTNVLISQLRKDKLELLIKVLSRSPYNILCKWDSDDMPERPANFRISKWLPQSDLLKHPNVKLFITQGGLQSTDEAIAAGVPMIGIPMIGDQWYNVQQFVKFGIGISLELEDMSEENFLEAINKIMKDESYRQNIARFRSIVQDQTQSSLDRAAWWTEYLLRHGGKHLRSPAANMPITEYLELDLVLISLVVLLFCVLLTGFVVYKMLCVVDGFLNSKVKLA